MVHQLPHDGLAAVTHSQLQVCLAHSNATADMGCAQDRCWALAVAQNVSSPGLVVDLKMSEPR